MTSRSISKSKSQDWETPFLAALRNSGNVRAACKAAGIARRTAYDQRERHAPFAALWDEAIQEACDALEAEATRRAMRNSDTLLIFLLKAHRPEKYRDTVTHRGDADAPLEIKAEIKSTHEFDEAGFKDALDGFFDELASKACAGESLDTD